MTSSIREKFLSDAYQLEHDDLLTHKDEGKNGITKATLEAWNKAFS
jgi:hypothetical protein